jgi:Sulfotransferase family
MDHRGKTKFILGIGCQKSGTTWLYDYLVNRSDIFMPTPKELHVFDAMLRPDMFREFHVMAEHSKATGSIPQRLVTKLLYRNSRENLTPSDRLRMIENPQTYVDFFRARSADYNLVGEITPSYAAFSEEDFSYIRDLLQPHFHLKVILLLRDPVQRTFSAVRHFRRINQGVFDVALRGDDNALFSRLYDTPFVWERADYGRILNALDIVFPAAQVHVEFFENLFTENAVSKLCEFLEVPVRPAAFGKIVNSSPRPIELDKDLACLAREKYARTYDYCYQRFGEDVIKHIWA